MNDFVTGEQLKSFGAAVAAVVAFVNAARMLGGEKVAPYTKWVAAAAAILVILAARGAPQTLNAGIALAVNAVYVFLAALGGNEAVVSVLERRQEKALAEPRELIASMSAETDAGRPQARFWRRW